MHVLTPRWFLLLFTLLHSGCSTVRYLVQATGGQLALIHHSRPIADVVRDPRTKGEVRAALSRVAEFKTFAELNGLKATKNYQDYVDLHRDAAVWVVSACAPLEFKSKLWSFPVVGKISYLGWFDHDDAKEYAQTLRGETIAGDAASPDSVAASAWDVDVRPSPAYSTLGWFRDPVVSTMLSSGSLSAVDLAHTLFHESVHATFYVANQPLFNESLAEFVAVKLTDRFLVVGDFSQDVIRKYQDRKKRIAQVTELLAHTYSQLDVLYAQKGVAEDRRAQKESLLKEARTKLTALGVPFRELNNAVLIQYRTYHAGVAEFERIWGKSDSGDASASVGAFLKKFQPLREASAWPSEPVTDLDVF